MKLIIHLFLNFQKNRVWTWILSLNKSLFLGDSLAEVKGIHLRLHVIMAHMGEAKDNKTLHKEVAFHQIEEVIMGDKRREADQGIREANPLEMTTITPTEEGSLRITGDHRQ